MNLLHRISRFLLAASPNLNGLQAALTILDTTPMADELKDNAYFHADKHVSTKDEDEFERYPFAAKLARLIAKHYSSHGLVIGIYGQWGEGKSSLMDFVQTATDKLTTEEPHYKTIIVKFNPWRFSDEEQLLLSFFAELRAALDTATDIDTSALAADLLKYTQILLTRKSVFNEAPDEQASKYLALGSLEAVKSDINRAIQSTGRKLLILIDDSDRLSNEEVATTLRLVKLTADFTNTTYLLGINHLMVAEAIGRHYSGGDKQAGMEFLEKIIQVPLYLPPIQRPKMDRYLGKRLSEVLYRTGHNGKQSDQDEVRYKDALEFGITPALANPRSVYRLANILLVAIPLLEGEANVTDIILIESLRILFPAAYELVKAHESILIGSFIEQSVQEDADDLSYLDSNTEAERQAFRQVFGSITEGNYPLISLLTNLFPRVYSYYSGQWFERDSHKKRSEQELDRTKSVASSYYFNRYFYYAVLEGQIPEETFAAFLQAMRAGQLPAACEQAQEMIKLSNDEVFFKRLELRIERNQQAESKGESLEPDDTITPDEAERYCDLIICISKILTYNVVGDRAVRLLSRSSSLILSYLKRVPDDKVVSTTKRIITQSFAIQVPFELILDIRRIRKWKAENQKEFKEIEELFTEERFQEIARVFIDRIQAAAVASGKPWYEKFGYSTQVMLDIWRIAYGKESVMQSLNPSFDADPENLATFFKYAYSTANTGSKTVGINLDFNTFAYLQEVLDTDSIYKSSKALIAGEVPIALNRDVFMLPTEHERVHQFVYFYEHFDEELESEMKRTGLH